jgi:hypothetical protein
MKDIRGVAFYAATSSISVKDETRMRGAQKRERMGPSGKRLDIPAKASDVGAKDPVHLRRLLQRHRHALTNIGIRAAQPAPAEGPRRGGLSMSNDRIARTTGGHILIIHLLIVGAARLNPMGFIIVIIQPRHPLSAAHPG